MKLERLHEYVTVTVVTVIGILLAIYCGNAAGGGRMSIVGMVSGGAIGLTIALIMGKRIWLLIPWLCLISGRITPIPVPLSVAQLGIVMATVLYVAFRALKLIRQKPLYGMLDFWMLVNVLYVVTLFARHPTGVLWFNSDRIAGRPYFEIIISLCAYWVLVRVTMTESDAKRIPAISTAVEFGEMLFGAVTYLIPSTAGPLGKVYSAVVVQSDANSDLNKPEPGDDTTRLGFLSMFGGSFTRCLMSYFPTLSLINPLYFFRFVFFLAGILAILLGGFRSSIVTCVGLFIICSYLKQGWRAIMIHLAFGIPALSLLILVQGRVVNLPFAVQRALSFLPGKWDATAASDAKGSAEWRFEMWRRVLTEKNYIESKVFGDGFGYSQKEFRTLLIQKFNGQLPDDRDIFILQGHVHSGPVSAIMYAGYVGLCLFCCLMFAAAGYAWKLIRRSQGTPFSAIAFFFGLPLIWLPFNFIFIFGAYEQDLPLLIFQIGMLRAIDTGLRAYKAGLRETEDEQEAEALPPIKGERRALIGASFRL